jgi:hypothetical protein
MTPMPRFSLRTLLIVLALGPMVLAMSFWLAEPYLRRNPSEPMIQWWLKRHKNNPYAPPRSMK